MLQAIKPRIYFHETLTSRTGKLFWMTNQEQERGDMSKREQGGGNFPRERHGEPVPIKLYLKNTFAELCGRSDSTHGSCDFVPFIFDRKQKLIIFKRVH